MPAPDPKPLHTGSPDDPLARRAAAAARLTRSREHLLLALHEPDVDPAASATAAPGDGTGVRPGMLGGMARQLFGQVFGGLLTRLQALPMADIVLDAVQDWWASHPLRLATRLAAQAAEDVLTPLARRHPVALVLGAAGLGAAVVIARPWRWLRRPAWRPALLAGLLPQILARLSSPDSTPAWAELLSALLRERHAGPTRPAGESAAPAARP